MSCRVTGSGGLSARTCSREKVDPGGRTGVVKRRGMGDGVGDRFCLAIMLLQLRVTLRGLGNGVRVLGGRSDPTWQKFCGSCADCQVSGSGRIASRARGKVRVIVEP